MPATSFCSSLPPHVYELARAFAESIHCGRGMKILTLEVSRVARKEWVATLLPIVTLAASQIDLMGDLRNLVRPKFCTNVQVEDKPALHRLGRVEIRGDMDVVVAMTQAEMMTRIGLSIVVPVHEGPKANGSHFLKKHSVPEGPRRMMICIDSKTGRINLLTGLSSFIQDLLCLISLRNRSSLSAGFRWRSGGV
ncbi:hypothetical protein F9C07_9930 [Aspergillus flavus]|uniref:Uncharacterized protein n=1 Tax=Aspergillus flavus (strain ATCC 200026 / FGSC A1120 / IAM 13836 / NRRL 3357 / JCM 12722 / SRRC 167) TaxID=332952 RepID=A0A7U2QRJ3_ASPFN|nr:hypothetical protein F9C07_9930 [Aspergillus flavus]